MHLWVCGEVLGFRKECTRRYLSPPSFAYLFVSPYPPPPPPHLSSGTCVKGSTLCPNSDLCGIIERGVIAQHLRGCQYRRIECHMCELSLPLPHLQVYYLLSLSSFRPPSFFSLLFGSISN